MKEFKSLKWCFNWIWLAFQITQPSSDQDGKMALINRLKRSHPQLKYFDNHLSPLSKTTQKNPQSWKPGWGRQADETNTLHIKQGYLAMIVTFIFWKQNWHDFPGQPRDHLSWRYTVSPCFSSPKRGTNLDTLRAFILFFSQSLALPSVLKWRFTVIDPKDTLLTVRMDRKFGD